VRVTVPQIHSRRGELETVFPGHCCVALADAVFLLLVKITVNGDDKEVKEGLTVSALLAELQIRPGRVVVELNREIVPRELHGSTTLKEGDVLEIVHFVGGG
jgi:sulfur carrier protein